MFTKRKGILLMVIAPILFIISMLSLANTLVWPAESVPYKVGQVLCFVVAPAFLVSGIIIYLTARSAKKKKAGQVQPRIALPPKETFLRVCSKCRRDLSALPTNVAVCPYCGKMLRSEAPMIVGWERGARRILAVSMIVFLPSSLFFSILGFGFGIVPTILSIAVIIHLLKNRRGMISSLVFLTLSFFMFTTITLGSCMHLFGFPATIFPGMFPDIIINLNPFNFIGLLDSVLGISTIVEKGLLVSSSSLLVVSSLSPRIERVRKIQERGTFKAVVVTLILLPLIVMSVYPQPPPNPAPSWPTSVGGSGSMRIIHQETVRYRDEETGEWTYRIRILNSWQNVTITKISADYEIVAPPFYPSAINVTGAGFLMNSSGITINEGADGVIQLKTTEGHSKLRILLSNGDEWSIWWMEF